MITYGPVCSGIEAATVAWHSLGFVPSWFSEIEPFPRALLRYRYPQVPNLGDMTRIAAWVRAGIVSAPDVLVGGTPCQAFSIAGVRAGLLDPRGQLTLAYADLLNAIDEKRPGNECVAVWENVPGVLSDKTNAFGCFLAILAGEDVELVAPGGKWPNAGCVVGPQRTIAWRVLDAQYFGVAQRRRRVFVVASAREGFDPAAVLFELDGVRRDSAPSRETGQSVAGTIASRTTGGGFPGTGFVGSGYLQPVTCMAHGQGGAEVSVGRSPTLTCNHEAPIVAFDTTQITSRANDGPRRMNGALVGHAVRRLTPCECERLQGFPDDYTAIPFGRHTRPEKLERDWAKYIMRGGNLTLEQVCGLAADGPRYKTLGNSMAVPCMRWIGSRLMFNLLLTRPSLLAHTVQNQGNQHD